MKALKARNFTYKTVRITPNFLLFLISAIASFIFACISSNGLGLSPDSFGYISTARNLASGNGLVLYDDSPYVSWPPLYPVSLTALYFITGIDPLFSTSFFHSILLFGIIYIFGKQILLHNSKKSYFFFLLLGLSYPIFNVLLMVWTEPLFIFLCLSALVYYQFNKNKLNYLKIVILSIITTAAIMTRYIGITLVITVSLLLIIDNKKQISSAIKWVVLFTSINFSITLAWLIRNYIIFNTFTGLRESSPMSLLDTLTSAINVLIFWFPTLIITILFLAIVNRKKIQYKIFFVNISPYFSFCLIYLVLLMISASIVKYDPINNRLLSPIYLPLLISIFFAYSEIENVTTPSRIQSYLLTSSFIITIAFSLLQIIMIVVQHNSFGIDGYIEIVNKIGIQYDIIGQALIK